MKTLETNDWIILNTIIYKVYTMEDFDEMRKELLEQLKLLVDFDSADFYLASAGDEKKLDRPVCITVIAISRNYMRNWITAEGLCSAGNR